MDTLAALLTGITIISTTNTAGISISILIQHKIANL